MRPEATGKKITLISPAEVSKRLGVSNSTLAKWRLTGEGPAFIKLCAKIAYDEDLLQEWLASRVRRSTSDCGEAA